MTNGEGKSLVWAKKFNTCRILLKINNMIGYLLGNGSANGRRKSNMLKLHAISIEKEWGQIRM